MEIKKEVQDQIISIISKIGTNGATITEIEKHIKYERHTLSKYLSFMEGHGLIEHRKIGKAKVWFINKAPIKSILNSLPEKKTYTEKVLSNIVSNIPQGLAVIDKDYNLLYANKRFQSKYNCNEGDKLYKILFSEENPMKLKKLREVVENKIESAEVKVVDKKENYLKISASKVTNPDKSNSYIFIVEDVTKKVLAEIELLNQKNTLQAEKDALNASAIVAETDLFGKITYVNNKFVEISGYSRKELIGKTHKVVNSRTHSKDFFQNMWKTISKGNIWTGLITNKNKKGSNYYVETAIAPVLDKNKKPVKYIAIRFDVTKYIKK